MIPPNPATVRELCQKILEYNGGKIADKSRTILLEDPNLKELHAPLKFISENWRDPLTPSMMALACSAVGGNPEETEETALAMSLMNLSFYIWDDIIDTAPSKLFKPTLYGKFGENTAIIVGGIAAAKAFTILNQNNIQEKMKKEIGELFWILWARIAQSESINLADRKNGALNSKKILQKIETESAADLGTCLRIGAMIGNGTKNQISHLGRYGQHLNTILELSKDFQVSANLTLELPQKIETGALSYTIAWARERSERIQEMLRTAKSVEKPDPKYVKEFVKRLIETTVSNHILKSIMNLTKKGKEELESLDSNEAIRSLEGFIDGQIQLFEMGLKISSLSSR